MMRVSEYSGAYSIIATCVRNLGDHLRSNPTWILDSEGTYYCVWVVPSYAIGGDDPASLRQVIRHKIIITRLLNAVACLRRLQL